jgi:hypothetical protein
MMQSINKMSHLERGLLLLISAVVICLGISMILQGYAPSISTRFGYTQPLFGVDAKKFGFIVALIGTLPLLAFCKSSRQAKLLGTALGVSLVAVIFVTVYS